MRSLIDEQQEMRRSEAERANAIANFERDLTEAVNAMASERHRWEEDKARFEQQIQELRSSVRSKEQEVGDICLLLSQGRIAS